MKKGHWILLDEINLAAAETLECLSGLLEGSAGSLVLLDRGDTGDYRRHLSLTCDMLHVPVIVPETNTHTRKTEKSGDTLCCPVKSLYTDP